MTMRDLTEAQIAVLLKVRDNDAFWTSDIAYDARFPTSRVRSILVKLSALGLVEVVAEGGKGYPTSWRRTPAGRAMIAAAGRVE